MDNDSKQVKSSGRRRPPNAGQGRKLGSRNKIPMALKQMIRQALDEAGGSQYLLEQARANPGSFLSLVGKLIPAEITAEVDMETTHHSGGLILIPQRCASVEEWLTKYNLGGVEEYREEKARIEGGNNDR